MNNIGEVKTGTEIWGSLNRHKFIWCACETCGYERWVLIVNGQPTSKWCNKCAIRKPRRGQYRACPTCKKDFYCPPSSKRIYCSRNCRSISQYKQVALFCQFCGKGYSRSLSQIKWRGSSFCSNKCKGQSITLTQAGKLNHQWKGGISPENHRLRAGQKWREWRKAVFERDNYTCMDCGKRSSVGQSIALHPHHIKSFSQYPDLHFEVNNGITLCVNCHKRHTAWQNLRRLLHGVRNKKK